MSAAVGAAGPAEAQASEAPRTLNEPAPRVLGFFDQIGLWGNLGVSLLGFTGAMVVLFPGGPGTLRLSLLAALLATVVGTVLGSLAVAAAAVPGTQTGAPAMVLLRGLFGAKVSYLPTAVNIVQMVGWGTFELVTIAAAARAVAPSFPRWALIVIAGAITTALAMRPLGAVRVLRKYVTTAVVVVLVYLFVQLLRHPMPSVADGTWSGFWIGVDSTVAVAVSWVPMAADFARHSRSSRTAFGAAFFGYSLTQIACYALGLIALVTVAADGDQIFGAFIAVPLGTAAFAVLAVREIDQSFANVYSTTLSTQNLRPAWDRRVLAAVVGTLITVLALGVDIYGYASFLSLIGSIFVPMFAVLLVDYFVFAGRSRWDLSPASPSRRVMLLPWLAGFVMYQLIYPGDVSWWADAWQRIAGWLHFSPQAWMSASLFSFVAAAAVTLVVGGAARSDRRRRTAPRPDVGGSTT